MLNSCRARRKAIFSTYFLTIQKSFNNIIVVASRHNAALEMSQVYTKVTEDRLSLVGTSYGRLQLDGRLTKYGDFRDALGRDGYAVIKGAVPNHRALAYSNAFYTYLEGL